ncbi:hypothetical protein ACELLULO517_25960 [Acidisoma cellulosilytica]|uniref:Uncharacterized protein n=1 Tax=Acidisoma cellulosilyticum TaxID=2802395 RepID=A0A963Z8B9_9PROT|nr:hypothetical protein [Acidisoma cellulosilyticum]MCB8883722.1 hypothetical protein [Acidisoma cellulosilyticum]
MPKRPLLLDGFDSRLIAPVQSHDIAPESGQDSYKPELIRTRLLGMIELLFGGKILVTEGWALDSISFIIIGGEIAQANAAVANRPENVRLPTYSPLLMESRRGPNFFKVMDAYLHRSEVRWHAFPADFKSEASRKALRQVLDPNAHSQSKEFYDLLQHITRGRDSLFANFSALAKYFGVNEERFVESRIEEKVFHRYFRQHLKTFANYQKSFRIDDPIAEELVRARSLIVKSGHIFETSTRAMNYVEETFAPEVAAHLRHTITAGYLDTSAYLTGSNRTSPQVDRDAGLTTWLTNFLPDVSRHNQITYAAQIQTGFERLSKTPIMGVFDKVCYWVPLWEKVIALARSDAWRALVEKFRRAAVEGGIEAALRSASFNLLEEKLATEIPELVLQQSTIDRIRFQLNLGPGNAARNIRIGSAATKIVTGSIGAAATAKGLEHLFQVDVGSEILKVAQNSWPVISAVGGAATAMITAHLGIDLGSKDAGVGLSKRITPLRDLAQLIDDS